MTFYDIYQRVLPSTKDSSPFFQVMIKLLAGALAGFYFS